MKKAVLFALYILYNVWAVASPALKLKIVARQPDGHEVTLVKGGDEHVPYYLTGDGFVARKSADGVFRYVCVADGGEWQTGEWLVHEAGEREAGEKAWLAVHGVRETAAVKAARSMKSRGVMAQRSLGQAQKGNPTIPVILVQYSDVKFTIDNAEEAFHKQFNAENYTETGGRGSVRDYFVAQSAGVYAPDFEILDIVTLPETRRYYGRNNGFSQDINVDEMVRRAVELSEAAGADFSKFKDENGQIPLVSIVYAGVGEHSSDVDDAIWAQFNEHTIRTAGGTIYSYLVSNELFYNPTNEEYEIDGIGVFCHEFSHFLGLPDFYNTNYDEDIFGLSFWSIMDYGQYWADGKIPVGYTAYERHFMRWLDIETLDTKKQLCKLNALGSPAQNAYYIYNENETSRNEYYILENRQPSTWFPKKLGTGMLVFHVDYDYVAWQDNEVNNNAFRQRMTIIPADGSLVKEDVAMPSDFQGDFFPGLSGNTALGDDTQPAFNPYRGEKLGKYLTCITDTGGVVTFCYMADGVLAKPANITLAEENGAVRAEWGAVENADSYRVEISVGGESVSVSTVSTPMFDLSPWSAAEYVSITVVAQAERYVDSPENEAVFSNLTKVESVTNGEDDYAGDVYDAVGARLLTGADVRNLRALLPAGVYIVRKADGRSEKVVIP